MPFFDAVSCNKVTGHGGVWNFGDPSILVEPSRLRSNRRSCRKWIIPTLTLEWNIMCIYYAYVGLVNNQYFRGNPWDDALVKELFLHPQNAEGNLSTVNQFLKLVILLHTEEKLPHDNISHFLLLEVAHCYNLSYTPAMNFEPRSLLFMKIDIKCLKSFFYDLRKVWKWGHRKIPGTARCAQATII